MISIPKVENLAKNSSQNQGCQRLNQGCAEDDFHPIEGILGCPPTQKADGKEEESDRQRVIPTGAL